MNLRLVWTLCGGDARENHVIFALNGSVFEMYLDITLYALDEQYSAAKNAPLNFHWSTLSKP